MSQRLHPNFCALAGANAFNHMVMARTILAAIISVCRCRAKGFANQTCSLKKIQKAIDLNTVPQVKADSESDSQEMENLIWIPQFSTIFQ